MLRRLFSRTRGFPPGGNGAVVVPPVVAAPAGRRPPRRGRGHARGGDTARRRPPLLLGAPGRVPGRGGAHLGLQWNDRHPGFGAANWGGYAAAGGLLEGTASALASTPDDPNTRDYPWLPGRPYRLRVRRGAPGAWRGEVVDLTTGEESLVRELYAPGEFLHDLMVWSEVFARCDDPSVVARWSDFTVVDERGDAHVPTGLAVNYQAHANGGCANTVSVAGSDGGVLQVTNAERVTPQGAVLPLSPFVPPSSRQFSALEPVELSTARSGERVQDGRQTLGVAHHGVVAGVELDHLDVAAGRVAQVGDQAVLVGRRQRLVLEELHVRLRERGRDALPADGLGEDAHDLGADPVEHEALQLVGHVVAEHVARDALVEVADRVHATTARASSIALVVISCSSGGSASMAEPPSGGTMHET